MRNKKMALLATLAATAALSGLAGNAQAVASYGDIAEPGVYMSAGLVPNGNWTIDTSNGVELALRAKNRETFALFDGSSGTYVASTGLCMSCTGLSKAMWNYEFSVNSGSITGLSYLLGVDRDPTVGTNFSWIDPQSYFADNAIAASPVLGFQNSENVAFDSTPGGVFDTSAAGTYTFTLQAFNGTTMLASATMNVQVTTAPVPEPASYALMLAGIAAIGLLVSRRRA